MKYIGCVFCDEKPPYDLGSGNEYELCQLHTNIWERNIIAGCLLDAESFIEEIERVKS